MEIVDQSWEWEQRPPKNTLEIIENAGRTCYQSEPKNDPEKFVRMLKKNGHHSVLEHVSASVRMVTNRGVTHELVRHRLASFSQESTRYVRYGDIEFIRPVWWQSMSIHDQQCWLEHMHSVEAEYLRQLQAGMPPQMAREILPNAIKTEIVMTANLREWMHVFKLRCSKKAHPQIAALMNSVRDGFRDHGLWVLF